jgi:hypothetical protein
MAALTTIAVTNVAPGSATITFNAASIDVNAQQIAQLATVVNKLMVSSQLGKPSDTGAVVTIPANF